MQPETVVCRDWQEYKTKIVAHLFPSRIFSRGTFLFRGQSDPKWELKSSYDRWFEAAQLGESKRMPLAQRLLDRFRHELPAVEPGDIPPDEMGVLALAQHYGLPTRLLDWSESPYIAAFFCFRRRVKPPPGTEQRRGLGSRHAQLRLGRTRCEAAETREQREYPAAESGRPVHTARVDGDLFGGPRRRF